MPRWSINFRISLAQTQCNQSLKGGSPGLVVTGGDSRFEGCGFVSRCRILDGHFITLICCKIVLIFVWERPKVNEKEAGDGPFFNNHLIC